MKIPDQYFEDEVREGFYVPGMIKRAWAAQLEILEDIKKVCEKHNIQYFAEWGTLLGAVRHGGFIPWDDDMDLCMKRSDYNRFLAVAKKELPQGYSMLNFHDDDDYWQYLTRVVNSRQISFDEERLEKFHGFPFVVGIDIFPMDFLAQDPEEERLRCDLAALAAAVSDVIGDSGGITEELEQKICQLEEMCNVRVDRSGNVRRQLYTLSEQLFSLYGEEESSELTLMPLWMDQGVFRMPKSYYEHSIMLPFENTQIPVPAAYDAVLRLKYGEYVKPVHCWDSHDYPFYKRQEHTLEEERGKRESGTLGGRCIGYFKDGMPCGYTFSMEHLKKEGCAMKQSMKKKALEMLSLIGQAHESIEKAVKNQDAASVKALLEGCQYSAIRLGNLIEESQGEEFVTVRMLEEYCEMVYQIYEQAAGNGLAAFRENREQNVQADASVQEKTADLRGLRHMEKRIRDSINNDIKERIEAVFLPYKASMWDSLESVWRAAADDPDCEAYVIPIPYYDKNPDGSFREMHYEGSQYPDYVPVTNYETFDFAAHMPDMIFIHNPYDACNLVTSVHPYFYASNLKQYTKSLVYIPCFILDEIHPKDSRAAAWIENFAALPGVVHADKVIVQSEDMKQVYINALTALAGGQTRKIWEAKIYGLGSPKTDKAVNTKKEELDIPDKWLPILKKPDGSDKKIVLYNTSVGALLSYNEKMLEKMRDVFSVFKKKQDEVALIWRPHPLMKATMETMRPQLWEEYQRLVQEYCEEGFGIYDDTADLHRAVCLSDAYYGDGSSVIHLFTEQKKRVMWQDVDVLSGQEAFIPNDGMWLDEDENAAWFVGNRDNVLYRMELADMRTAPVAAVPAEPGDSFRMTPECIKYRNKICCLPDKGDCVWVYDLETRLFNNIQIDGLKEKRIGIHNYWIEGNVLWCVSCGTNRIYAIDLESVQITGCFDVFDETGDQVGRLSVKVNNKIYCVSRTSAMVCEFDIVKKELVYFSLCIDDRGINTIAYDGADFWLTGYSARLYRWHRDSNYVTVLDSFPDDFKTIGKRSAENQECFEAPLFYNCVTVKNFIFFIPWNTPDAVSNKIIYVDKSNLKIKSFNMDLLGAADRSNVFFRVEYLKDDRYLVLHHSNYVQLIMIDTWELMFSVKSMQINYMDTSNYMKEYVGEKIICETGAVSIERFISYILVKADDGCIESGSANGDHIYWSVKDGI